MTGWNLVKCPRCLKIFHVRLTTVRALHECGGRLTQMRIKRGIFIDGEPVTVMHNFPKACNVVP